MTERIGAQRRQVTCSGLASILNSFSSAQSLSIPSCPSTTFWYYSSGPAYMCPLTTIFIQHKGRFSYSFLQFLDMHYSYETDGFWCGPMSEQKKIVCWNRRFNQTMLGKLWFRETSSRLKINKPHGKRTSAFSFFLNSPSGMHAFFIIRPRGRKFSFCSFTVSRA